MCVVIKTFREQRTARTVNHPAGENFFFGRTAFAFEVTAGEATHGSSFLTVFYGEWEKIEMLFRCGGNDGDENDGIAELDNGSAVGLFGEFAGFD